MFTPEQPISSRIDDILGRTEFAARLAGAVHDWTQPKSLVIGLHGSWGSGKTSVLNLLRESLEKASSQAVPTVIEFNPWMISGQEQLLHHFFVEIAQELDLQNQEDRDQELADKLRMYSHLLLASPDSTRVESIISYFLPTTGALSVLAGAALWLWPSAVWGPIIGIFGILLLLARISGTVMRGAADFLQTRATKARKTLLRQKQEICDLLSERGRKLLIIIDDIDRLTRVEVRQIIRLIRVNSDFPNTVFLLAFDRSIIERSLDDISGVSGRDYLEKVAQVSFEVPDTNPVRIRRFFLSELDRVLNSLPAGWEKCFDMERWENLYHSGFRDSFTSIRNIKRFCNTLRFNLLMLVKDGVLEVNPIDFMAIECIRIFCPEYYAFMRHHKELFAFVDSDVIGDHSHLQREQRQEQLDDSLRLIPKHRRESIKGIIKRTFPGTFDNTTWGPAWLSTWNKNLRVKSPEFYDAYFRLTPGGDEDAVTQGDITRVLASASNLERFSCMLREHIDRGTIRTVLQRLQDFTDDNRAIPDERIAVVVQSLFDISDDLPESTEYMLDFGATMDVMRIVESARPSLERSSSVCQPHSGLYKGHQITGRTCQLCIIGIIARR